MKFKCGKCQTKYAISDEKVKGRILKIRCKKCSQLMVIKGKTVPDPPGEQVEKIPKQPATSMPVASETVKPPPLPPKLPVKTPIESSKEPDAEKEKPVLTEPLIEKTEQKPEYKSEDQEDELSKTDLIAKAEQLELALHDGKKPDHQLDEEVIDNELESFFIQEIDEDALNKPILDERDQNSEIYYITPSFDGGESTGVFILRAGLDKKSSQKKLGMSIVLIVSLICFGVVSLIYILGSFDVIDKMDFFSIGTGPTVGYSALSNEERLAMQKRLFGLKEKRKKQRKRYLSRSRRTRGMTRSDAKNLNGPLNAPMFQSMPTPGSSNVNRKKMDKQYALMFQNMKKGGARVPLTSLSKSGGNDRGSIPAGGKIDPSDHSTIIKEIKRQKNAIKFCYEQALKKDPSLKGRMDISIIILTSGKVEDVIIRNRKYRNHKVGKCVKMRIKRWRFPQLTGNKKVQFDIPFHLSLSY